MNKIMSWYVQMGENVLKTRMKSTMATKCIQSKKKPETENPPINDMNSIALVLAFSKVYCQNTNTMQVTGLNFSVSGFL